VEEGVASLASAVELDEGEVVTDIEELAEELDEEVKELDCAAVVDEEVEVAEVERVTEATESEGVMEEVMEEEEELDVVVAELVWLRAVEVGKRPLRTVPIMSEPRSPTPSVPIPKALFSSKPFRTSILRS